MQINYLRKIENCQRYIRSQLWPPGRVRRLDAHHHGLDGALDLEDDLAERGRWGTKNTQHSEVGGRLAARLLSKTRGDQVDTHLPFAGYPSPGGAGEPKMGVEKLPHTTWNVV